MQSENHYTETDLGNVAPNPRGNFDSTAKYEYLDLVAMQGGSYLCLAELGQTITGIAPEAGKNTEHWQCVAIPGNMTPEYTDAYGKVVRLAREVEQDAAKVAEDKQSVTQMETNARQLKEQAEESARQAENSKDSAAGSAREAKKAEESARQAENNVGTLVNGFDTHVTEKTAEATQAVATAKDNAIQAVERQETASVQGVKDQTGVYITEQKELAKQELDDKVNQFGLDVNAIKTEVTEEGTKQIKAVQDATVTELAKITEKGTEQTGLVTAEGNKQVQAVQKAAQEIAADREQINTNKEGVAQLKEEITDIFLCSYQFVATDESGGYAYNIKKINIPKGTQLRFYGTGGNGNVLATSSNGNVIVTKLSDGEVKDVTLEYDVTGLGFYINKPATVNVRVYGKSLSAILDYTNNNVAKVKNNLEKLYTVGYSFDKAVDGQYQYGMVKVDIKQGSKIKILVEGNTCNILAVTKSGNVVLVSGVSDGNIYDVDVTSDITQLGYYAFSDGRTKITIFGEYLVKFIEKANPYNNVKGKKVLFLGDSITHFDLNDNGWCKYFNQIVNPSKSVNVAVSGATWLDKSETVLNGNPSTYESVNNTISNQVEKIVRGKDSTHSNYVHVEDYDEFDIIIIACGTNDSTDGFTTATDDERYNSCYNKFGVRLDVDSLNRKIIDGATMYAYEKLHALYPNAVFFYCTPIQCYPSKKTRYENENKGNILKDIGRKLSITVIDSILCGINGNHEQYNSEGTDLADGLHPNARGAKKLGLYNAREVVKYFSVELPK